jgi:hypothetical protein
MMACVKLISLIGLTLAVLSVKTVSSSNASSSYLPAGRLVIDDMYASCGVDSGCFGCDASFQCVTVASTGCLGQRSCSYMVHFNLSTFDTDERVRFSVLRRIAEPKERQWVGMGISSEGKMVKKNDFYTNFLI